LRGYRVRLRVVEEYDIALWAESAEDAKARAEVLARDGEGADSLVDSWPEGLVSVEAVAAERYPDIE
jgi:hypothetical protein